MRRSGWSDFNMIYSDRPQWVNYYFTRKMALGMFVGLAIAKIFRVQEVQ